MAKQVDILSVAKQCMHFIIVHDNDLIWDFGMMKVAYTSGGTAIANAILTIGPFTAP